MIAGAVLFRAKKQKRYLLFFIMMKRKLIRKMRKKTAGIAKIYLNWRIYIASQTIIIH